MAGLRGASRVLALMGMLGKLRMRGAGGVSPTLHPVSLPQLSSSESPFWQLLAQSQAGWDLRAGGGWGDLL